MQPERREPSGGIEPLRKAMHKLSARGVNWLTRSDLIGILSLNDADAAFVLKQKKQHAHLTTGGMATRRCF